MSDTYCELGFYLLAFFMDIAKIVIIVSFLPKTKFKINYVVLVTTSLTVGILSLFIPNKGDWYSFVSGCLAIISVFISIKRTEKEIKICGFCIWAFLFSFAIDTFLVVPMLFIFGYDKVYGSNSLTLLGNVVGLIGIIIITILVLKKGKLIELNRKNIIKLLCSILWISITTTYFFADDMPFWGGLANTSPFDILGLILGLLSEVGAMCTMLSPFFSRNTNP